MIIPKLSVRNILGAGTKTWLNAVVLSLAFVTIIWGQSLFRGIDEEGSRAMIDCRSAAGSTGSRATTLWTRSAWRTPMRLCLRLSKRPRPRATPPRS